ncbi:MAG: molybdopterin-dependent oxidoreductase [Proteobacteria bacterium]|nr:molybdopterin-dependent oxidoreductase [Pseudomonadota bacterium]
MAAGCATKTTCPYCGVGCGLIATRGPDGAVDVKGDPEHPANFGRICSKGAALAETISLEGRLLAPTIGGSTASWDEALDVVAERFSAAIEEHGPESVAFYVSGQLLTEDYYVANKLMKGFIGAANIDSNSRLCMASSVAGHKRAFGSDTVPGCYEDLELADLVVLVGSNLAWCHPVLYQRLAKAREERGTKIVVIDPRETATCEIADLHLAIKAGADVALFNALLAHLIDNDCIDKKFIGQYTSGLDAALASSRMTLSEVVDATGLAAKDIKRFYALFAETEHTVTVYSQGVNQSTAGTDKVNAIINCHLATGRIGRPGMGPFSVTGQPNAMGGRETGGLANMLAAHLEIGEPAHREIVAKVWGAKRLAKAPGLKAVDLFRAVGEGKIKALWIMGTNPAVSLPDADKVRAAIETCPFVVVSDVLADTDTTRLAHVLLPSAAWGEKDGTVTNSERRISRQRAFLPMPGEAKPDWWQMTQVARRMGFGDAFPYRKSANIFAEHARLTAAGNEGTRDLDIGAHAKITPAKYDALEPFQWPRPAGNNARTARFFADGHFFTPDGRARFVATPFRVPEQQTSEQFPLVLNTGRIRDQWHTMTRTARAPRLMAQAPEPFVDVAPADAAALRLEAGGIAEIANSQGCALVRVVVNERQQPGSVFVPMHWTSTHASRARVDVVVGSATDPVSGQPELKHTGVGVRPLAAAWHGFGVMARRPSVEEADYVAIAPVAGGFRAEFAGLAEPEDWDGFVRKLSGASEDVEVLGYRDAAAGQHRFAMFENSTLIAMLFVARRPLTVAREWITAQLGGTVKPEERLRLLAGRPGGAVRDKGPTVCACFEIGRNEIVEAIRERGAASVAAVGQCVKAGTNCGACRPEIQGIIDANRLEKAV